MTDRRIEAANAEALIGGITVDRRLDAVAVEVLLPALSTTTVVEAVDVEVLVPVLYVVSAYDGLTAVEQLHTDGIWRRLILAPLAPT